MQDESYIKIKKWIGYILAAIIVIGMNGTTDATGHRLSFLEAILLAIIIYILNTLMWSDWMYNYIRDEGAKISYIAYQKIGIFVSIALAVVIFAASLAGHNIYNVSWIEAVVLTFLIYIILLYFVKD